jgi:hypothetical protein
MGSTHVGKRVVPTAGNSDVQFLVKVDVRRLTASPDLAKIGKIHAIYIYIYVCVYT